MSRISTPAAALALACAAALFAPAAGAQDAPPDSALRAWHRAVSDSTDAYFGLSAEPADTAGLDSALAGALAEPAPERRRTELRLGLAPSFAFNRALGAVYGGSASAGVGLAKLTGSLKWAGGPREWYGGGEASLGRSVRDEDRSWSARIGVGRRFGALDRDYYNPIFAMAGALAFGSDRHSYLRRDGVRAEFSRRSPGRWVEAGYRNELESPLATTTTWSLFGGEPGLLENAPAAPGRASELRVGGGMALPWAPFTVQGTVWNAGGALGGDLGYHRYRLAVGGGLGLGSLFALAPQLEYGRLTGGAPAQDVFYVGGRHSLLTVESHALAGTGRAVGRVELLMHDDVFTVLGLRQGTAFPIQVAAFAGAAARWGYDPATGAARVTPRDWPGAEQWMSEAGVSLMFRPGIPDPDAFLRVDYAWPLGPGDREGTLQVSWQRTLHLLGGY